MPAAKPTPRQPRARDSATTKQLIVDAAAQLLADRGFTALGINALATQAGVDKQLIYYHFGGLDGVVRQLGGQLERWLGVPLQARDGEPYGDAVQRLLLEYAAALRQNPLVLRLLAWEVAEPSDALQALEHTRSAAMAQWVQDLRAAAQPVPAGIDAPAINAVLLAALQYLALRAASVGSFAGMDVRSPEGVARIERAVRWITTRTYAGPADAAAPAASKRSPPSSRRPR